MLCRQITQDCHVGLHHRRMLYLFCRYPLFLCRSPGAVRTCVITSRSRTTSTRALLHTCHVHLCCLGSVLPLWKLMKFSLLICFLRRRSVSYGPDSVRAVFEADSCSEILGLPTCGLWVPDDFAFIKLLTHEAPAFLGAWWYVIVLVVVRVG